MKKLVISFVIVLLFGAFSWHLGLSFDQIAEWINLANLKLFILEFGIFGPLVFCLIYYLLSLGFVSASFLTVLSGLLFGAFWGSVYVVVAATLAAATAFWISRSLSGDLADKWKNKKGFDVVFAKLESAVEGNGFRNFFILRCLFLPYILLSYGAGTIGKARFRDFILATFLTNAIFSPAFVYLGDSLLAGPQALILPAVLIVLVLLVPRGVRWVEAWRMENAKCKK